MFTTAGQICIVKFIKKKVVAFFVGVMVALTHRNTANVLLLKRVPLRWTEYLYEETSGTTAYCIQLTVQEIYK